MDYFETLWYSVGSSGFVLFMEGVITAIFTSTFSLLRRGRGVKGRQKRSMLDRMFLEHSFRAGAGLVLLIIAIVELIVGK